MPLTGPKFTAVEERRDYPQIVAHEQGMASYVPITVLSGQDLVAGTVVGRITASGFYRNYLTGAADGSETAVGIITEPIDASAGQVVGRMLVKGTVFVATLTGSDAAGEAEMNARRITDATGTVLLQVA